MRHRKVSRRFSRSSSHRVAMMRNLAISLIEHEIIKTTAEKGKDLRRFIEPLITRAKADTLHNRREVISSLNSRSAASKLFSDLGPRFKETKGGYLRVIKAGFREGDRADMCYVELTIREVEQKSDDDSLNDMQLNQDTKESAPQKLDTVNNETKEPATTKAPAKKTATKEPATTKAPAKKAATKEPATTKAPVNKAKKEKPKENWWSRFFK